jgi:S-DNA-T family DNA segregation ATPase FtsK/SpoIIIE
VTLLIDNAEDIPDTPLGQELGTHPGGSSVRYWVACQLETAANAFKGPIAEAKRARQGLLLWPTSSLSGTQILGTTLPKTQLGRSTPGRAAYLKDGDYETVQIPLAD